MVIRVMLIWLFSACASACTTQAHASSLRLIVPESPWVAGEMIPITIRGEYSQRVMREKLEFPNSQSYDWIQLSRDRWDKERIDGQLYSVFERRLAVFPRVAGRLTLGPVTHHLSAWKTGGGVQETAITAPPINLAIAPYPVPGQPLAAASLTLEETLSSEPGKLGEGESLIRKVTLTATGTLSHQLPERPSFRQPWLISFAAPETRQTTPTPDGPVSQVTWEWHMRPRTGEPGVVPEVTFPWFDTANRKMKTARLQAIPFGYASFHSDIVSGVSRISLYQLGKALLAYLGGLFIGLAWLLPSFRPAVRKRVRTAVLRLLPEPTVPPMRDAARAGDLMMLRAAGERHVQRRLELDKPLPDNPMRELDTALFAPHQDRDGFDFSRFLRLLTR